LYEMGIRGIAIPYGAPNAAAHIERMIGTLRRECLDRMLIWNERHLRCVLTEFIGWYNHGRVHQGLDGIPDPDPILAEPKPAGSRLVAIPVLNGLHHDYQLAV
jgi:putative transposase